MYGLISHVKEYGFRHKSLYLLSFMVFFWVIFEGILEFIIPVSIIERGFSKQTMGLIIGFSSFAGLIFDFIISRVFANHSFRRTYLLTFIFCAFYPAIVWQAQTVWIFLLAMGIWGLYYDLYNFSNLDFVAKEIDKKEHSSSFGVISVFASLGYFLSPLIIGSMIDDGLNFKIFMTAWIFLGLSFLIYLVLSFYTKIRDNSIINSTERHRKLPLIREFFLWRSLGLQMLPVLSCTFLICLVDSAYWTIGPLLSDQFGIISNYSSLFMSAFLLPSLIAGWMVGLLSTRYGKKKTAYMALFISSLLLIPFYFISHPLVLLAFTFLASMMVAIAAPSLNGVYADFISETEYADKEIEGLTDSANNLGYVIGPILAGFSAQYFGNLGVFSIIGLIGIVLISILFFKSPKEIKIKI